MFWLNLFKITLLAWIAVILFSISLKLDGILLELKTPKNYNFIVQNKAGEFTNVQ